MTNQPGSENFNVAKAEAFAGRLVGTLSEGALALMTSLGHRIGLYDALAIRPQTTSAELAREMGLSERYVREWLGVMVTSGVVVFDPEFQSYTLPPEHSAFLTRASGSSNIAVNSQFIGVVAAIEDEMIARFQDGAGTHYHQYDRFHEVMAEASEQTVVGALIDAILPLVPGIVQRLEDGINVVDVGCGAGHAMLRLANTFPESTFTGIDLCADAFAKTEDAAKKAGVSNLSFKAQDLSVEKTIGEFDLITAFDAIHDQKDPQGLLNLIYNSLSKEGFFLMQEIGGSRDLEVNIKNPFAPLMYTISLMHCTPISVGQGGPGLGAMWGVETAREFLEIAGFSQIQFHRLPHDPINAYFVSQPLT